ncbi:MFS transporter [Tenuibacillus multivorans]|uniref:Predicted arabinose efflux permease, MFS family n=1 Tax=Tenuibacillus multivorans TaxID=237069 RepID=A0A1H0ES96_9BACI|nr:MFS transporter [Tenuibacillus multivorans]SDN85149.1 Predicted arabinose efflux permease, MFS family [Tenuibacillus multivorans]
MSTKERPKLWTLQYLLTILVTFIFFFTIHVINSGFPIFILSYLDQPTIAGSMLTAFMLSAIITRPIFTIYMPKLNLNRVILFILFLLLFTFLITFSNHNIYFLLLTRVLEGICFGVISTILATKASMIIPTSRMGEGFSYFALATTLGASMAPGVALIVIHVSSFNLLLFFTIILVVLLLFLTRHITIELSQGEENGHQRQGRSIWSSVTDLIFDRRALFPCVLMFILCISFSSVFNFIDGLGEEKTFDSRSSLFFVAFVLFVALTRIFSGYLFDRGNMNLLIYGSALIGFIGLQVLSLSNVMTLLILSGIFYGVSYGMMHPTLQAFAVSRVQTYKRGTANMMFLTGMDLGMAFGSVALGWLADQTSFSVMFGATSFLMLIIVALLIVQSNVKSFSRLKNQDV